jgi:predicted PurR-regulated permease PerM
MKVLGQNKDRRPSMRSKVCLSLGSLAAILLLSGVLAILEYRRMSDYVSELIAANIKSINLSQKLSDITQEYNHQMLAVVVQNDISMMPTFDLQHFMAQSDSLKNSFKSEHALPMVDSVVTSFDNFMKTSLKFDEVFLADNVDTGEWFFGTLQPCYNDFRRDMNTLNESIYNELQANSADFDAGFYRSIIPGVVSVGAGLLLILLLLYFTLFDYVRPICKMAEALSAYRSSGRRYNYTFDGDDQLAEINEGIVEVIEENLELKARVKSLREERNNA